MHTDLIGILLWRSLAIFLLVGALLGMALGLLLIFRPHLVERINHVANRWVSMRHIDRLLDRSISIEHWFYRHHRPLGILVILGAGYILVYFGFLFDKAAVPLNLTSHVPSKLMDGLLDAAVLTSLLGAAVALLVGFFLWLRPSLLRGVEKEVNQWVSSRRATKALDLPHDQFDHFVARHTRQAGWLLSLGSLYLFFLMFRLLA
ncbi:MAG TPA: hypothetical protein VMW07_08475 [Gallionella sp.]|jgi:hypothetical protein|nr:hypothetical protein [Gallionella sp.]